MVENRDCLIDIKKYLVKYVSQGEINFVFDLNFFRTMRRVDRFYKVFAHYGMNQAGYFFYFFAYSGSNIFLKRFFTGHMKPEINENDHQSDQQNFVEQRSNK